MVSDVNGLRDQLEGWRDAGADRVDPLRFHQLEALAKRVPALQGDVREAVESRLAALAAAYEAAVCASASAVRHDVQSVASPLAELTEKLAARVQQGLEVTVAVDAPAQGAQGVSSPKPQKPAMLDEVREVWSAVRLRSQLRQSLEPSQEEAGPLNSERLVQRMLVHMRDVSPGYLRHFMAYADVLSGLQQLVEVNEVAAKTAAGKLVRGRRRRG